MTQPRLSRNFSFLLDLGLNGLIEFEEADHDLQLPFLYETSDKNGIEKYPCEDNKFGLRYFGNVDFMKSRAQPWSVIGPNGNRER